MNLGIISSDYKDLHLLRTHDYESADFLIKSKKFFNRTYLIDPVNTYISYTKTNCEVFYGDFTDIRSNVYDDIDILYVKRTRGAIGQIMSIIDVINKHYPKITIVDNYKAFQKPTSKINGYFRRFGIINQPNSIMVLTRDLNPVKLRLEFPLIIKPSSGYKGKSVSLIRNYNELDVFLKDIKEYDWQINNLGYGYIIQEYLEIKHEYRVIVIGGRSLGCVEKFQTDNIVARNYAQGGQFVIANDNKAEKLAEEVSLLTHQSISGVDIVVTKSDEYYVLECNRNPSYSEFSKITQIDVSSEICKFMKKIAKSNLARLNMRKKIFIGSSSNEGVRIAEMVHLNMYREYDTTIWNHSVFKLGKSNLESLVQATEDYDYAILILTPDDKVLKKESETFIPRDNILFELGLFIGKLGSENVFMLVPEEVNLSIPSDLDGIVYASYPSNRTDGNLQAAIDVGCIKIKNELKFR